MKGFSIKQIYAIQSGNPKIIVSVLKIAGHILCALFGEIMLTRRNRNQGICFIIQKHDGHTTATDPQGLVVVEIQGMVQVIRLMAGFVCIFCHHHVRIDVHLDEKPFLNIEPEDGIVLKNHLSYIGLLGQGGISTEVNMFEAISQAIIQIQTFLCSNKQLSGTVGYQIRNVTRRH